MTLGASALKKSLVRDQAKHSDPFSKVKYSERQNLKYQSDVDIDQLIQDAESELAVSAPEEYKIFLLGCMAGLRRREIDLLEWSSFK
jgi:hypothetical protein